MDWCGSFSDHGLLSSTAQADKYRGRNKMTRYAQRRLCKDRKTGSYRANDKDLVMLTILVKK
jgi:hypothetical protein